MEQLNLYLFRRNNRVHRIKPNSRIAARSFQHRRWQLITLLEQFCGFWPYQNKIQQYLLQLFHAFFTFIVFSAVANKSIEYVGVDTDMTIECCLSMFCIFGLLVKFFFASKQQFIRQKAYKQIFKNFETIRDPEEATVLNESAERGFKFTLVYMGGVCLCIGIFYVIPVLQAFYHYFFNHRELEMELPLPSDFGFDHSKYWYIITIAFVTWLCSVTLIDFAYDLSFMLQVRHAAALFKIVQIRLRKASEFVDEFAAETMSKDAADESYLLISSAINLHAKCLDLVKHIEECHTMNWFIILLLSTGGFGAGLHLLTTKLDDPMETLRYTAIFTMVLLHFQVIFSQGQMIIDSNPAISDACCELKWYGLPKKSRQLLLVMMIRTSIPCQLTGAKLFPLSMETFSKMLKASLSYYAVFREKC